VVSHRMTWHVFCLDECAPLPEATSGFRALNNIDVNYSCGSGVLQPTISLDYVRGRSKGTKCLFLCTIFLTCLMLTLEREFVFNYKTYARVKAFL
jgi:hypothetical protein